MKGNNRDKGRRRMKKKTPYLPHELIIQILLRLPVKSLIHFKCVSKSWLTLISDTHFANSHFQLTAATHTRRILFISGPALETPRSIDFEASLNDNSASVSLNLNFMHPQPRFYLKIKATCRGFIFLHRAFYMYLWNPSTGVHRQIPLSPIVSNYCCYLYGFGYDRSTDDYLVVKMSYDTSRANVSSYLALFSVRDNTWKEIEGTHFPYTNACMDTRIGSLFNGAIHGFARRRDLSMDVIVGFDLMERKLLEMSLPDDFHHDLTNFDLWVFKEFLSLWAIWDGTVEIWVMKEYKVGSSWTKTLVLSIDDISTKCFFPICSTISGDIIGTDGGTELVKYDDKGQLLEHRSYYNDARGTLVAMYTESLLSLPGDNEQS